MSKKRTYRLARHCRLGGVGMEVQLTEDEAIQLTNETPGALEGPFTSSAAASEAAREPVRDSPVTRAARKDSEAS